MKALMLVLSAAAIFAAVVVLSPSSAGDAAWTAAKKFVTKSLVAPTTAKFPDSSDSGCGTRKIEPGVWEVWGYVDSQNGFGAMIRTDWRMVVENHGDGNWRAAYIRAGDEEHGTPPGELRANVASRAQAAQEAEAARIAAATPVPATPSPVITLIRPVDVPARYGKVTLPAGTQGRFVSRAGAVVRIEHPGGVVEVPAEATNLSQR